MLESAFVGALPNVSVICQIYNKKKAMPVMHPRGGEFQKLSNCSVDSTPTLILSGVFEDLILKIKKETNFVKK